MNLQFQSVAPMRYGLRGPVPLADRLKKTPTRPKIDKMAKSS